MITVSIVSMVGTVRRDRPDGSPDVPQRRTNCADGADAKAAVSVITQMTEKHIRSMDTRFRHSRCPALSEADPLPTCSCEPRAFGGGPKSRSPFADGVPSFPRVSIVRRNIGIAIRNRRITRSIHSAIDCRKCSVISGGQLKRAGTMEHRRQTGLLLGPPPKARSSQLHVGRGSASDKAGHRE
jgi:hypothetical protein